MTDTIITIDGIPYDEQSIRALIAANTRLTVMLELKDATITDLRERLDAARTDSRNLQEQIQHLTRHNARGAGRKRADDAWTASYAAFCTALDAGKSRTEIMQELSISERTYYRYLKLKRDTAC